MNKVGALFVLTVVCLHAQDASDRYYDSIRKNDLAGLRELVKAGSVDVQDKKQSTPLMYAAGLGSVEAMRILLDAGADPKAKNGLDATALHWCANDFEKVRLLVEKGADVNAEAKSGRTPLTLAAVHPRNVKTVAYLLDHGAKVNVNGPPPLVPLVVAIESKDVETVKLLLDRGADVKAAGGAPLQFAAGTGSAEMARMLLDKGADVNAVTPPNINPNVKNGPILLGSFRALHLATTHGPAELVKTLLDAGADVNVKDVRGMTPLMYAVCSDRANPKIVKMLLDKGADLSPRMNTGETAADWAAKYNDPRILPLFGLSRQTRASIMPAGREKVPTAREAFDASLTLLQRTSGGFFKEGGCVACHAQPMAAMVMQSARANKIALREDTGAAELKSARLQWSSFEQRLMQKMGAPGDPDSSNYALALFDTLGAAPDRTTDAMIVNLLSQQLTDGRWRGFGFAREPMEGSDISRTALAIRAIRRYAIPARMTEIEDSLRRATAWLQEAEVLTTEDRSMQILGLLWSGKSKQDVQKRAKALVGFQRQDGGWSQTANLDSDAYATGQSLYALVQAGVKTSDPAFRRGAAYLLKTQHPDGSWHVLSRSPKFQPYFQSGFPHDHDQWISMSATAWAASALAYASSEEKPLRASR